LLNFHELLTTMIKAVRVSALAVMGAFLLSGVAFASDPAPAPPSPPAPPAQSEAPPSPPETPAPPATQTTEKDPRDEVVCRKEEGTVGSRLGARKVCKTRRQWRDEREAANPPDGSQGPKVNN
jgi:hypothetical protein